MKRCLSAALLLVMLLLTACGGNANPNHYTVQHYGREYEVSMTNNGSGGTITVDGHVCRFTLSGKGDNITFNVTYPDGSTYYWTRSGNIGHGGWSDDYDENKYAPGDMLWDVLSLDRQAENSGRGGNIFAGLLIAGLGLLNLLKPEFAWHTSIGWQFKNVEPSELSLTVTRVGGAFLMGLGVIYLLFA